MRRTIVNAFVASFIVAIITAIFSILIRGNLNWLDVINSVIGTFIIWAVFIPLVNKHWRGQSIE